MSERVYYAIGDVHGEAGRLERLHGLILEDVARHGAPSTIVHLGDLIDRGPHSREAVAAAMALHERSGEGLRVVSLRGNHEQMLLDALEAPHDRLRLRHWLENGGDRALESYGAAGRGSGGAWWDAIDPAHAAWIAALPTLAYDEGRGLAFVHAGIDPARFPDCDAEVRLWTRSPKFFDPGRWPDRPALEGVTVIHGHTPTPSFTPHVGSRRINIDTGAVFGGPLTAAALAPGEPPRFLTA